MATKEMSAALGKQGVTNIRIPIKKVGEKKKKNHNQHLHPDIKPTPHSKKMKIGYCIERFK